MDHLDAESELRQEKIAAAKHKLEQFKSQKGHDLNQTNVFSITTPKKNANCLLLEKNSSIIVEEHNSAEHIAELEKIENEHLKQNQKLIQSNATLSLIMEQKTSENEFLKRKCSDYEGILQNLESQIADLRDQLKNSSVLLKDIEEDKVTISRAMEQNKTLKDKFIELDDLIVLKDKQNIELNNNLQELSQENSELKSHLAEYANKFTLLQLQLNQSQNTKNELKERCNHLTGDIISANDQCTSLTEQLQNHNLQELSQENSELKSNLAEYANKFTLLELQLNQSQNIKNELKERCNHLTGDIISANDRCSSLTEQLQNHNLQELSQENSELKSHLAEYAKKFTLLELQLNQSQNTKNELKERCNHLTKDIISANDRCTSLTEQLQKYNSDFEALQQENQNLKKENDEYKIQQNSPLIASTPIEKPPSRRQYIAALKEQNEVKRDAFALLENRFKKCMDENVDLRERNDRLEHLITLLEGESECIGEYIAIYHAQRNYLNRKFEAREVYLKQLLEQQKHIKRVFTELRNLLSQHFDQKCSRTIPSNFQSLNGILVHHHNSNSNMPNGSTIMTPPPPQIHNTITSMQEVYNGGDEHQAGMLDENTKRIIHMINHVLEPLIAKDHPFTTTTSNTHDETLDEFEIINPFDTGRNSSPRDSLSTESSQILPATSTNNNSWLDGEPNFPTFKEYHSKLSKQHLAACKCCHGQIKNL